MNALSVSVCVSLSLPRRNDGITSGRVEQILGPGYIYNPFSKWSEWECGRRAGEKSVVPMATQNSPAAAAVESRKEVLFTKTLHDLSEELKLARLDADVVKGFEVNDEDRPTMSYDEWADLPVIDLSSSRLEKDRAGVARELGDAAREWGFFQIVNHGISSESLDGIETQGLKFFDLPAQDKLKLFQSGGYTGNNTEEKRSALHWAESWSLNYAPRSDIEQKISVVYPQGNDELRDALNTYCQGVETINKKILELLAEYLGLGPSFFSEHLNERRTLNLRWNYYPACPKPFDVLGANGHTDGSSLTVLKQDKVGGLQIFRDGRWFGVKPIEGALVVNIGDALHAWSNGHLKSVLHRVVVNQKFRRLSLAAFVNADSALLISAPDALVDEEHPRLYQPFTFMDYIHQVLRARQTNNDPSKVMNGIYVLEALRIRD